MKRAVLNFVAVSALCVFTAGCDPYDTKVYDDEVHGMSGGERCERREDGKYGIKGDFNNRNPEDPCMCKQKKQHRAH